MKACVRVWGQSKARFTPHVQALSEAAAWLQLFFYTDSISSSSFLFINEPFSFTRLFFSTEASQFWFPAFEDWL